MLQISLLKPLKDYSVEVSVEVPDPDHYTVDHKTAPRIYGVKAHIIKLPSSELAPEKSSDAPEVVAKCPRRDNFAPNR